MAELDQAGFSAAPMVTELLPVPDFVAAEPCHRQYFRRNSEQGYCQSVVSPKLAKFRQRLSRGLKANQ